MKDGLKTWSSCVGSFVDITLYQAFSRAVLAVLLLLLRKLAMLLLASTGRVAVTTGDFLFIFTSWQGILLLLFGLVSLYFYVVIDINTKIVFANKLLKNEKYTLFSLLKESLLTLPRFFNPGGALIVFFISLLAPLIGADIYISLTRNLRIPTFISSVIESNGLYHSIYLVVMALLLVVGILHVFSIFAIVIDNKKPKEAFVLSRRLIIQNWKAYLKQTLLYLLSALAGGLVVAVVALFLTWGVTKAIENFIVGYERRYIIFLFMLGILGLSVFNFIGSFCYIVRMSQMYYSYQGRQQEIPFERRKGRWFSLALSGLCIVALAFFAAFVFDTGFDAIFVKDVSVSVIAHRAGGTEAPENTVEGIEKAVAAGAYGSEIDIQRTIDGFYVVNHDGDFSRLCGVARKPEEMTLAEVKELVIRDPLFPGKETQVATFEEMLEAAKGRIVLFTELKGATADKQMVDDAVALIRQYKMEDQCVLISLKYDVIDYAETTYPDIQTAYLMFASFGDMASLNCDFLGLEEESATDAVVDSVHAKGKKVLVWTPNSESSQRYFLLSDADAIITDRFVQANGIIESLKQRNDFNLFSDWILRGMFH